MRKQYRFTQAFTLPTVLITSLLMLTLLLAALQLATTSANALRTQYYNQLAREASESGLTYARACLARNNDVAQWSNATVDRTLTPATDCAGLVVSGASAYVIENSSFRTSFEVGKPFRAAGVQRIPVSGKIELKRKSDGQTYRSYSYALSSQAGASTLINSVGFGYTTSSYCVRPGAFFATIDEFGVAKGAGLNACGQLGNGGTGDVTVPTTFGFPSTKRAAQVFTNFLSLGTNLFVLTTDGEVWGSGANEYGQLGGSGGASTNRTTPVKFVLPASDNIATFVSPLGWTTFVVTSNGNIYAAGRNQDGVAGVGNSPYGANNNVTSPQKITLPSGEKARADDQAWAVDRLNAYVITESGKVYGWGENVFGQLARSDLSSSVTPIQINLPSGVLAEQVAFDGATVYIRANNGKIYSAGRTTFGQTGTRYARFRSLAYADQCLVANGSNVTLASCSSASNNRLWRFNENGELKAYENSDNSKLCIDNQSGTNQFARMYGCNNTSAQQYTPAYQCSTACESQSSRIVNSMNNLTTGKYCLQANAAGDGKVGIRACGSSSSQHFIAFDPTLREIELPTGKQAVDVTTDQWFAAAVMNDGSVYSWGLNNGAFGNGVVPRDQNDRDSHLQWNPTPVKYGVFGDPGQPRAVKSWTTSNGWDATLSNIFVVTNDGKVYGTGSNVDGQLGTGSTNGSSIATPQEMLVLGSDGNLASIVRSGRGTTVVYTSSGKVFTVGDNGRGQLGDGTTVDNPIPRANNYTNVKPGLSLQY